MANIGQPKFNLDLSQPRFNNVDLRLTMTNILNLKSTMTKIRRPKDDHDH